MPIVKRLIRVGNSRAVTIPNEWLEYYEKERGEIKYLIAEIDNALILKVPEGTQAKKNESGTGSDVH
jgi:antitoxin component of MazEF toxin-antitoxin module